MVDPDQVFQSYGRSCNNPSFFEDFYSTFMGKSDDIRNMFAETDMESQRGLLRGGIMWLVMHARGMSDSKIRALGESHSRGNLNIHPSYYGYWLDALIETLHKHDPQFDAQLEQVWRDTLTPSIEMIKDMY
ncbi:globin [Bacterioplanes sanyensis]|uniref:Globin n=1 Tax=Bacterioplanes sanyensis TaxID=1249553 RepID=A0A222FJN9_9GAMM|nr:globin [Bacterioplanes sanyensis]ASP38959.1 globin [Bacterioplanes sanyensis]